jgi:NADH dehydrogenase
MTFRVFLTGGTGFVGSRMLEALDRRGISVTALDRTGRLSERVRSRGYKNVETIQADLLDPSKYSDALKKCDLVLHFAALTGRGTEEEHFRVTARGTETLVEQSRLAGVSRILFTSTIATKFPDKNWYYYAQAKVHAEDAVRKSGMRFTIIRPTIIIGRGSPVLAALDKLATLPVIPVFGTGRAMVQPIYVDDLVDCVLYVMDQDRFTGETLELGGPVRLSIEELMQSIRQARRGGTGTKGPAIHIPLGLLLPPLRLAESLGIGRFLPVSVGQLSSFRYDGTVENNSLQQNRHDALRDVREMLALSLAS